MESNDFSAIKIGLASPETIRNWSCGEVQNAETINYRTQKPEKGGLFCEAIFGPTKDWECACGKYKKPHYKGKVCEKCGVEVTLKKVRRERMGHIELNAPVAHIWYVKAVPSKIAEVLEISPKQLESVIYFLNYIVINPGDYEYTHLVKKEVVPSERAKELVEKYGSSIELGIGAEAIKKLLQEVDLEKESTEIRNKLDNPKISAQSKARLVKRLDVIDGFRKSGNKPEWMILDTIPVIPPDLRPMVQLDGGRIATSDINDLYREIINRNMKIKELIENGGTKTMIIRAKQVLQEAVDQLFDNGRHGKARMSTGANPRPLKSLSEILKGKQGRFRQNLLGKRVDFSGRSVIVVGPSLKIHQCGLPKEMALELFKPFVMKRLIEDKVATNMKDAKKKIDRGIEQMWDALEIVIKDHPVLLNRAPTLHRLSIQAFEPILVEGRAIRLHPLVCAGFNADFDGDQMPIHVPLTNEAQAEARFLMLSSNNLIKPADGKAIAVPAQDMVLGSYYLTMEREGEKGEGSVFRNVDEAIMAYENGALGMHAPIKVRVEKEIDGVVYSRIIDATLGRLIFNKPIPQDLGRVNRATPDPLNPNKKDNLLDLEINQKVKKKDLGKIVDEIMIKHGPVVTADVLDQIMANGFKYSTKASISISVLDASIPKEKPQLLADAEAKALQVRRAFQQGRLSEEERYRRIVGIWTSTTNAVTEAMVAGIDPNNALQIISDSGARGNITNIRQLAGMVGVKQSVSGREVEVPVRSNYREGLNVIEYFLGAKGSRKALSDTALKTSDSGYLTRRLVDVASKVVVKTEDCGTKEGLWIEEIRDGQSLIAELYERLNGRYVVNDVVDPTTGEVLAPANTIVSLAQAKKIQNAGIKKVLIRSVLTCGCKYGVCTHCYGSDLSSGKPVSVGEAVGVIAAQSIGEPGTQLTMRNFHTGGVAGASDITQGLPRVEEIFEARKPKAVSVLSEVTGTVTEINDIKRGKELKILPDGSTEPITILVPYSTPLRVEVNDRVNKGQRLCEGNPNPIDVERIEGLEAFYNYVICEVRKVYKSQDIAISDKHIETIAKQMTQKIRVVKAGNTDLMPGETVEKARFIEENEKIQARIDAGERDLCLAEGKNIILGIAKASTSTESFLSAASFQETTKVLADAAIKGKVDKLIGLKENIIIGRLIPAGTGLHRYDGIKVKVADEANQTESASSVDFEDTIVG